MKSFYNSVTIIRWERTTIAPSCSYFQAADGEDDIYRKISYEAACKLQWELQLAGGIREIRTNELDPAISYVSVYLFARH